MRVIHYILGLVALVVTSSVYATDSDNIKEGLEELMPSAKIQVVKALADTGLYEVVLESGGIIYITKDLSYGFEGNVIDMKTGKNITEAKRKTLRKELLASLDESELIIYEPKKTEHTLTVFTDIECGYCRKLHSQMEQYNSLGIRVRYLAFPRAGLDSEAFDKLEDVWCADDRLQAMTDAKNGKRVDSKHCESPVASQYKLGGKLGVSGTPALFLESGDLLPGYIPPRRLKQILDERSAG